VYTWVDSGNNRFARPGEGIAADKTGEGGRRVIVETSGYKCVREVGMNETDFMGELRLSSMLSIFQEVAEPASVELGFGFDEMRRRHNAAWILTRIRVDVTKYPRWRDEIVVETWNRKHSRATFERDFVVRGVSGEPMAAAVTSWVVLDVDTRAMKSAQDFGFDVPDIEGMPRAIECRLGRVRAPVELAPAFERAVRYFDVDVNGHVNNARYCDYTLDCLPIETHRRRVVRSIEIGYANEARAGDVISLRCAALPDDPDTMYFEGADAAGGTVFFRARTVMADRAAGEGGT
jgi:acyl-ACP thioesterase